MCNELGKFRYTWPGKDESLVCEKHAGQLKGLASIMGFHLQIIPMSEKDLELNLKCNQKGE